MTSMRDAILDNTRDAAYWGKLALDQIQSPEHPSSGYQRARQAAHYGRKALAVIASVKRPCECTDPGCSCKGACVFPSKRTLRRVDMADEAGTRVCEECAADAFESGLFY